jgi:hypothetical protein
MLATAKESEDQRQRNLAELFRLIAKTPLTEDFIPPRTQDEPRNPFADGVAPLPHTVPSRDDIPADSTLGYPLRERCT